MEYPDKKMSAYIKKVLSENPFYLVNDDGPDSLLGKKIATDIDLSNYFDYDAYAELSQCVLVDVVCESILENYIAGEEGFDDAIPPDINSPEVKKSFDESFRFLYTNWHKFTPRSLDAAHINVQKYADTDTDLPFSVFKIIYESCPLLCYRVFPVVLFIIADSFYDFCNICSGKSGYIPKNLEPGIKLRAFNLFHDLITRDNRESYMLSLLNSKGLHYAESSVKIGEEISDLALKDSKNDIVSFIRAENATRLEDADFETLVEAYADMEDFDGNRIIEQAFRKLRKRYSDGYETKREDRAKRSSTFPAEPTIGENFIAFLNLLANQPDNVWKTGVDSMLSLYAINRITGWVSLFLLHNTFPHADQEYGLSSFDFSHLYSLKYIMNQVEIESDYTAEDAKKYPIASWLKHLMLDADKLCAFASNSDTLNPCNLTYTEYKNILQDNYEATELYSDLTGTLYNMKEKEDYKWFDLDRLVYQLTYYTLGQYARGLSPTDTEKSIN